MSLRLHLLRSRSGLQFCAPQNRIRSGHWHRLRAPLQAARLLSDNAQKSDSGYRGVTSVDSHVETSATLDNEAKTRVPRAHRPDAFGGTHSVFQKGSHAENHDADVDLDSNFPPELEDQDDNAAPRVSPRLVPSTVIGKLKNLHNIPPAYTGPAVHQLNEDTKKLQRFLRPRVLYYDVAIRATSLCTKEKHQALWSNLFAQLVNRLRSGNRRRAAIGPFIPYIADMADLLRAFQADPLNTFDKEWRGLDRNQKQNLWQHLALWILQCCPENTPEFLLVTTSTKYKPNPSRVADCIWFFERFYSPRIRFRNYKDSVYSSYPSIVQKCLDPRHWPIINTPQAAIRFYTRHADHEGLCLLLKLLKGREYYITPVRVLGIVNRFVEFGDVDRALEAFKWIPRLGYPLDRVEVIHHCCKLLTLDTVQDGPQGRNFHILPKLLEIGVRPNRDMLNVVLRNASNTGDPQLARDVLKFIKGQNFALDAYTYSIALTDAVSNGDLRQVELLVEEVNNYPEIRDNPYVTSKIMHAYFALTVKKKSGNVDPSHVFFDMLDIYTRLYDITPLKELFILPPEYTPAKESANNPPSLMALYIVLATFFRLQRRFTNVERIYAQYRSLVLRGHPTIAPLAATDHTYNEFLVALRSYAHGLRLSVRILEDMMRSPETIRLKDPDQPNRTVKHVKPGNRTWTIIMSTFFWNKQPFAAEKIREMMDKHNIEFNQVSWNTIISGYANSQRIYETAEAIRTMESQGFQVDDYTARSLGYLNNQERLWQVMEEFERDEEEEKETMISGGPDMRTPAREQDEELLVQGLRRLEEKKKAKHKAEAELGQVPDELD